MKMSILALLTALTTISAGASFTDDVHVHTYPHVKEYEDGTWRCVPVAFGTNSIHALHQAGSPLAEQLRNVSQADLVFHDDRILLSMFGDRGNEADEVLAHSIRGSDALYKLPDETVGITQLPDEYALPNGLIDLCTSRDEPGMWGFCLDVTDALPPIDAGTADGIVELTLPTLVAVGYDTNAPARIERLKFQFNLKRRQDAIRFCRNASTPDTTASVIPSLPPSA